MSYKRYIFIAIIVVESIVLTFSLIFNQPWLPWALLLLVILGVLIAQKPIIGLLLFLLFIFPSRVLPITTGVTILKIVFIIALGSFIIREFQKGKITIPEIDREGIAIFILLGVILLSLFYSVDFQLSLREFVSFITAVLIYFLIVGMVKSLSDLRLVQQCLMISAFLTTLFMFFSWRVAGFIRTGAFGSDPNFFALFLIMTIPIAINEILISKSRLWKVLTGIMFFLILFAVPSTLSRGGLITLFLVLLFISVSNKKAYHFVLPALIGAGIIFALFSRAGTTWLHLLSITAPERISSIASRFSAMKAAFHVFIHHPLFGVGAGNFIKFYPEYSILPLSSGAFVAHNMYLEMLANLGIVGFIPFLLIIIFSYFATIKTQRAALTRNDMIMYRLVKTCQGMLLTFVIGGLFLCTQAYKHLWVVLALSAVTEKIYRSKR